VAGSEYEIDRNVLLTFFYVVVGGGGGGGSGIAVGKSDERFDWASHTVT
jgi:hypothetical protein